jgi:ubiquinone/menaquinone biosynthesis C-methylase UbiE
MVGVRTATVMFTDVVASTARSSRLGPARAEELRREHFDLLRQVLGAHRGVEVKTLGDGVMGVFDSVVDGLNAAVMLQQQLEMTNRTNPDALELRVGLSVGEVSTEAGDWFGAAVVEAARLCADAKPRQILCTSVLRTLAQDHLAHVFRDVGSRQLKGLARPTVVDEVTWVPLVESGIVADFAHIDNTSSEHAINCLDLQQHATFIVDVRQHLLAMLAARSGQTVMDVGCGAGHLALELGAQVGPNGRVIGIDKSEPLIDVARARAADAALSNIEFRVGDVQNLPLDDDSLDGACSDRVFQYLTDPAQAVRELQRVTRPSGTIVIADTDWGASMFDCDDPELSERIDRAWTHTRPSGTIGRRLYGLFVRAGLHNVRVVPHTIAVTDLAVRDTVAGPQYREQVIQGLAAQAVEAGAVTAEEASRWIALQHAAAEEGRFFRFLAMFIVAGQVP